MTEVWVDPITNGKRAVGKTNHGNSFELYQYGECVQVVLYTYNGSPFRPFMELATVEEIMERIGAE